MCNCRDRALTISHARMPPVSDDFSRGLPDGVRIELAQGGLPVISIDDMDPSVPNTAKLAHPISGADVFVLGSAHVSKASAEDVTKLIARVKPDVVLVELDRERLTSLLKNSSSEHPAAEAAKKVQTTFEAFKLIMKGETLLTVGSLGYAAVGAVLGTNPGAEFLAAVEGAQRQGCHLCYSFFLEGTH